MLFHFESLGSSHWRQRQSSTFFNLLGINAISTLLNCKPMSSVNSRNHWSCWRCFWICRSFSAKWHPDQVERSTIYFGKLWSEYPGVSWGSLVCSCSQSCLSTLVMHIMVYLTNTILLTLSFATLHNCKLHSIQDIERSIWEVIESK